MAKKEKTNPKVQTVASKAAEKVAAGIMRNNPEIKEVHVASDGTAFYNHNDALNYAKGLKNHEVWSFKRGNVMPSAAATSNQSLAGKKISVEKEKIDELTGEVIDEEPVDGAENDNAGE